jgi:hypothetical protein
MKLKDLVCLSYGTRLLDVIQKPCADAFMMQREHMAAYKVSDDMYMLITNHPGYDWNNVSEQFIYGIMLSASEGAARRELFGEIEADDGKSLKIPSDFLHPGCEARNQGEFIQWLKNNEISYAEHASYRMADGKFVCRAIESQHISLYFRSRKDNDSEIPFVIIRKLI